MSELEELFRINVEATRLGKIEGLKQAATIVCRGCRGECADPAVPRLIPERVQSRYIPNYGLLEEGWAHGGGFVQFTQCMAGEIWDEIELLESRKR